MVVNACPLETRRLAKNLITDGAGVREGHADDIKLGSGATVVLFDQPAVAAADLRGGGPGTRESALLDPAMTVERIDAVVLAGARRSGSTPPPARRPGSENRAAASRSAKPA